MKKICSFNFNSKVDIITKFILLTLILSILLSPFVLAGCSQKSSDFTEEEHIQRVTERIEKSMMSESTEYTDFTVSPLYDKNDKLNYFLVEFDPYGFIFVLLREKEQSFLSCFGITSSMYRVSNLYGKETWSPYTIDETNSQPYPDTDKIWKYDDNGNKIEYKRSPYFVTGNDNTKKYLLASETESSGAQYICAIKEGEKFINLISMEEIDVAEGALSQKQATLYIHFIADKRFDL